MSTLDSIAAINRARSQVGQADGAGACLANVYKWFGSVPSIGPGSGHYDWAVKGWNYTPDAEKHAGDYNAPAGVPVYFGAIAGPRWVGDANYPCGDIGLSIGGGFAIFTDSPTGNTGIMSIRARAAQIGRPYLGWTESFLGHKTTAGNAWRAAHTIVHVVIPRKPTPKIEVDMLYVKSKKSGTYYVIGETTVQPVSRSRAVTYSHAVPGDSSIFMVLSSAQVAGLIEDARTRRDQAGLPVLSAITEALSHEEKPEEK